MKGLGREAGVISPSLMTEYFLSTQGLSHSETVRMIDVHVESQQSNCSQAEEHYIQLHICYLNVFFFFFFKDYWKVF